MIPSSFVTRLITFCAVSISFLGITHASSLGNFVWIDTDADGQQDSTEVGMNGATIILYSATGHVLSTVTTASTVTSTGGNPGGLPGYYHFPNLARGAYSLKFILPTGHPCFIAKYTGAPETDSNADPTLGITGMITLIDGEQNLTIDTGFCAKPAISSSSNSSGWGSSSSAPVVISSPTTVTPVSAPVTPTEVKKPVKKLLPIVVKKLGDDTLRFVLPKKLLDTGWSLKAKWVKVFTNNLVETKPQIFFTSVSPDSAEKSLSNYIANLPEWDKGLDRYVVIPSAGIIAPIRDMPEGTDRKKIISGKEIQVNPYFRDGVLHYPNLALAGELGNMIISGHSSYWKSDKLGRYKTVFGNLPTVDVGEEVWVYSRERDPTTHRLTYILYRYTIKASYNTTPYDVNILLPEKEKKLITLFTCTPIGGVTGRWIVRGELVE